MEEAKICPDCGNDMDFHRLGCPYERLEPLRGDIAQLRVEIKRLKKEIEELKERIAFAVDYLPECPDKAKRFLGSALQEDQ